MDKVREIFEPSGLTLESKLSAAKKKTENEGNHKNKKADSKQDRDDLHKYQTYYDFSCCVPNLRSHQVGFSRCFLSEPGMLGT